MLISQDLRTAPNFLINLDSVQSIDSAYLQNKKLHFKGHVSQPVIYRLRPEQGRVAFQLWMENKHIAVSGDKNTFSDLVVKGSPLNDIFYTVQQKHAALDKLRDSLLQKALNENDKGRRREFIKDISDIDNEVFKIRLQTIASFEPSLVTINELYFLRNDLTADSLKTLFAKFPLSLRKTKYGEVINQYILTDDLKEGSYASEITAKTLMGKEVKLSSFKGQVVLLDFWASWCAPCRSNNRELVKLFEKYNKRGLAIVSFSIDSGYDDWKAAATNDGITWTNISDLQGLYSKQAASYKIRAIPKSFLIDKNGVITNIFSGYSNDVTPSLENKIIELIKMSSFNATIY